MAMLAPSISSSERIAKRGKKHIQVLHTPDGIAFKHEDMEKEVTHHFGELLDTKKQEQHV
jgi:hypothetical protein